MGRPKGSKNQPKETDTIPIVSSVDNNTFLVTAQQYEQKLFEEAIENQRINNFKSTYLNEKNIGLNFTIDDIDNLALNAQTDINKIIKINGIVRYFINKNDIIGKVYEALQINVNSDWKLNYPKFNEDEKETYYIVDEIIKDFNKKINLDKLISKSIPMVYFEGNFIVYLRKDIKNKLYQVDYYPIGVAEIADYNEADEPYVLINMNELRSRLQKIYKKSRKNTPLFYKDIDDEILATYPREVYDAYINKEQYAKLNIKNTGVMRVNNLERKYGLSPIFKALKPAIRLENIELSDDKNTLVRGKKIIFQKLIPELVTQAKDMPNITWSSAQAKSHTDLMNALSNEGVSVYTGLPWTESVQFIEPKMEQTNIQTKNNYKDSIMTTLGIRFLGTEKGSFGAAEISINELLKLINYISGQLEDILYKWYSIILTDNNIDTKYTPTIRVIDSEKLSIELSMSLARMLYAELNASLESSYSLLGLDIETEVMRRKEEKEKGYDEIFTPRMTAFTNNGDLNDKGGRPSDNDDLDRQITDKEYNDDNNR